MANTKLTIYFILFTFLFISCEENLQNNPTLGIDTASTNIALVICEGLWGYDNSTVSKINLNTLGVQNNFTSLANTNFKIGDIGNDLLIKGDTFFVVVTTTKALEYFDIKTGKLLGYITFDNNSAPRHIAQINNNLFAITDLYRDCVYIVNLQTQSVEHTISVGPSPEFVEYYNGKLYVTNSGYGDYRSKEPKANTLSVIDVLTWKEIQNLPLPPNPIELVIDYKRNKLFVSYNHLPSLKDSMGGIIMLELTSLERLKEWKVQCRSLFLDENTGDLYFATYKGIQKLSAVSGLIEEVVTNSKPNEIWYSVAYDTKNDLLFVGNAKNYTVEGQVIVFEIINTKYIPKKVIPVGVNPSQISIKY